MNTPNNKRRKKSQDNIKLVFIELIQNKELKDITVTDICEKAKLNRSTFYANYLDVYDLADKIKEELEQEIIDLYPEEVKSKKSSNNFLKLFYHIKDNQLFFKTYFKLSYSIETKMGYDLALASLFYNNENIDYHIEFFAGGFNAIIKKWLDEGCKKTPEEINQILIDEYKNKNIDMPL